MNLHTRLVQLDAIGTPLRIGLIGAGKFGSMYLSRVPSTPGVHLVAVADLAPEAARAALLRVGWDASRLVATGIEDALRSGGTLITDDVPAVIAADGVDIIIDATGHPLAGIEHVLACCEHGKHIIMVNVEADALAGPWLAARARSAGIVYSLAYGDQPALIVEMVDWARTAGFEVVAAGKGTRYLPGYHASTPDTVWQQYGLSAAQAAEGGMNARMFNSFLDGTKSAIEMASVANATGLSAPASGLQFPACGVDDLPTLLRPTSAGGLLQASGMVEVVSSLERDTRAVFRDLRWGVFVTFRGDSHYVRRCFAEYGLCTDDSGHYSAMYKPYHLIGLELGLSVASIGVRGEPTGQARCFKADVACIAKRAMQAGDVLDGEGGFCVYGHLLPAAESVAGRALPIGLAQGVRLARSVQAGQMLVLEDVELDGLDAIIRLREEMSGMAADAA